MCAIAGILHLDQSNMGTRSLPAMTSALAHRGPDDFGYLGLDGSMRVRCGRDPTSLDGCWLGLGHRRLSIIDLTEAGWQPMGTSDGQYHIVFNGEIYNYVELRRELERLGCQFRSTSDTEVLLNSYVYWGKQALTRFVGMFAFAILDLANRKLFFARDFFGIKPLYYTRTAHGLAFASEIKALLELPDVSRRANPERVYSYLRYARSDHGGETFYTAIKQLPAAHYLEMPLAGPELPSPVRYWQPQVDGASRLTFTEAAHELAERFQQSVKLHLRSDVPIGVALSGGLDSSSLIGTVRRVEGPKLRLHSFSYLADEPGLSEENWARLAGEDVAAEMHTTCPRSEDLLADLEHLVYTQDEPFGSTSMYAQFLVYRLARQHGIKVMLDGQGADELLAGYLFFYSSRVASLLRSGNLASALRFLGKASGHQGARGAGALAISALAELLPSPIRAHGASLVGKGPCPKWLRQEWFEALGICPRPPIASGGGRLMRQRVCQSLVEDSLPSLLRWQDRNSMAHSIESRVPFLTPALADFLYSLPEEYLVANDGTTKAVMREAMRGIVPQAILARRDKVAFTTPIHQWLVSLGPWVKATLGSDKFRSLPFFNHVRLQQEWQTVMQGKGLFSWQQWRWISLGKWVERFSIEFSPG
jgi:asparagine synthase (glutamine-hydrolysing)